MNLKEVLSEKGLLNTDRISKLLLVSLVLFFILAPFLEDHEVGEIFLILNLYFTAGHGNDGTCRTTGGALECHPYRSMLDDPSPG